MFVDSAARLMAGSGSESGPAGEVCATGGSIEGLPLSALEREISQLAADINAATCRWLLLAAEFDRRGGHEAYGFPPALPGSRGVAP
jgi:hypothetical protein